MGRESKQATFDDLAVLSKPSNNNVGGTSRDAESDAEGDEATEDDFEGWPPAQPTQTDERDASEESENEKEDSEGQGPGDAPALDAVVYSPPPRFIPEDADPKESMDVPEPAPADVTDGFDPRCKVTGPSDEELERAAFNIAMATEGSQNPKAAALIELPRWIDFDDVPDYTGDWAEAAGPDTCKYCGTRHPWYRPLERGRAVERMGDDGNPWYDECQPGEYNIESCSCCVCPSCESKSIYHRSTVTPSYRCRNPNCGAEFRWPVEAPDESDGEPDESAIDGSGGIRTRLYWECRACHRPVLAPFDGVPDKWFDIDGFSPPR